MRTKPSVDARLKEIERKFDKHDQALAARQTRGTAVPALLETLPPAMPLNIFLAWSRLTRRQYYSLLDRGAVRFVTVGERSVWPIPRSYIEYLARLDAEQNGPGAPSRVPVNPPPGRWKCQTGKRRRVLGNSGEATGGIATAPAQD
jgi:hypothetical protein